ncbi:hypothetical protein BG000_000137 [Podila horticola]|nr:hypothetical protein BG000_000137 [Podila horticola]
MSPTQSSQSSESFLSSQSSTSSQLDGFFSPVLRPSTPIRAAAGMASAPAEAAQKSSDAAPSTATLPCDMLYQGQSSQVHSKGKWNSVFQCNQARCHNVYSASNSSTSLKAHYETKHKTEYTRIMLLAFPSTGTQTTLDLVALPSRFHERAISACLRWFICGLIPFSTLDSPAFRGIIQEPFPMANMPCPKTDRAKLPSHAQYSWTSAANRPYLAIIYNWLDATFKFHECLLDLASQSYPHDANTTAQLIRKKGFKRGMSGKWDQLYFWKAESGE